MSNFDPKNKNNNGSVESEVRAEINSNYSKAEHNRNSAEPNMDNIDDTGSDTTIKNLNTNNSQGGK